MTPADALPTIAEIAITLAGFTGIVAVFRPPSAGPWSDDEMQRLRGLLFVCTLVMFCALLPFGLSGLQASTALTWSIPLVLFGAVSLAYLAAATRQILRGAIRLTTPRLSVPVLAVSGAVNAIAVLSGLGIVSPFAAPGVLILALIWGLAAGVVTLLATVVLWTRERAPRGEASDS